MASRVIALVLSRRLLLLGLACCVCSPAHAQQKEGAMCVAPSSQAVLLPALALQLERELKEHASAPSEKRPVFMSAEQAQGRAGIEASLQGHAEVRANGSTIRADRITYNQDDDEVIASGNVRVAKDGNVFTGPRLQLKVAANLGVFEKPTYNLGLYRGSGTASAMEFLGPKHVRLQDASFTRFSRSDWILTRWQERARLEVLVSCSVSGA
jgi:LPS-assembly protein